jgi:prolyl-tRNA editing enzyme YbaK/EbsC (Cys-tRNA(Pro) deacylase)
MEMQAILVSGGQRGVDLRLPVLDLMRVVRARIADVGDDGSEDEA